MFHADVLLLPLSGSDLVLEIQWLSLLGPVIWDFAKLSMQFTYQDNTIKLRGKSPYKLNATHSKKINKLLQASGELCMLQIVPATVGNNPQLSSLSIDEQRRQSQDPALHSLLNQFSDVFKEPKGLPPSRAQVDHKINLKEGTNAINMRPYRYSTVQKTVIEELVQELLEQGVIRQSTSPFAAPIVLVKKKDGGWRMCIDYWNLNKATIKDKFPIPIIEELLDELHGSSYSFKIDLKSGYHQIWVHPTDVYKTDFKTHFGHFEYLVMPFGLTSAPSTFQSLMNHLFKPMLRKGALVFFDDIFIYSPTWEEHITHLKMALQILQDNSLHANMKKCSFGVTEIHYLGHIISAEGVHTERGKLAAILDWPTPTNLKQLRGFLGLTVYYRRFIKDYGNICKPLTVLLKKNSFSWNAAAQESFQLLKSTMTNPPVLALPDFSKEFVIETDASGIRMGAVLMQGGQPIAYISKAFSERTTLLLAYERELLAIVFAVTKWKHYLMILPFIIRTDQKSLKFILEQKLSTSFQQRWLSKLACFDFMIEYKQGAENRATDALSRTPSIQLLSIAVSSVESALLEDLKQHWATDKNLQKVIQELNSDPSSHPCFTWHQGLLQRKGKLMVDDNSDIKQTILQWMHSSTQGGHSGVHATFKRIQTLFFWAGMRQSVIEFIRCCQVCQKCKYDISASPGLLQPIKLPNTVWEEVTMDFVEGLPKSNGKDVIMVIIDRLSKYAHFIPLSHPFSALTVAQAYLDHVWVT